MLECPNCHARPEGPCETTDGNDLSAGAWTVCGCCTSLLRFTAEGTFRMITPMDLQELSPEGLAYLIERKIAVHRRIVAEMARNN